MKKEAALLHFWYSEKHAKHYQKLAVVPLWESLRGRKLRRNYAVIEGKEAEYTECSSDMNPVTAKTFDDLKYLGAGKWSRAEDY